MHVPFSICVIYDTQRERALMKVYAPKVFDTQVNSSWATTNPTLAVNTMNGVLFTRMSKLERLNSHSDTYSVLNIPRGLFWAGISFLFYSVQSWRWPIHLPTVCAVWRTPGTAACNVPDNMLLFHCARIKVLAGMSRRRTHAESLADWFAIMIYVVRMIASIAILRICHTGHAPFILIGC